jgi:hypothetical protein
MVAPLPWFGSLFIVYIICLYCVGHDIPPPVYVDTGNRNPPLHGKCCPMSIHYCGCDVIALL